MTVKELIEKLQQEPQDSTVYYWTDKKWIEASMVYTEDFTDCERGGTDTIIK